MPVSRKWSFILAGMVLLAVAACWSATGISRWFTPPAIRQADVNECIVPQSREFAQGQCPIPLPDAATNIQFVVWSMGQVTQSWIRFEAPAADCLKHAQQLVKPFETREGWTVTRSAISNNTGMLCVLDPTAVDLSWFDLCNFSGGELFRVGGGRAPMIWVDTQRGCFYCEVKNSLHSLSPQ